MIDELLRYRGALKKASEELEGAGYTLTVQSCGKNILKIGRVKNKSYFGMLGAVEVVDAKKAVELARKMR